MDSQSAIWNAPVLAAVFIGLVLRVSFALLTPIGSPSVPGVLSSYNDEFAHANYVMHILTHGDLPRQVESIQGNGALERGDYENYQPPLYYLLDAAIGKLVGARDLIQIVRIGRFIGIILSVGIALVFLRIAHALAVSEAFAPAGLILIALNGVFVCFTSTLGNEPLFWLLAGGMILIALRMWQEGLRATHWMTFTVLAILAVYTKLTAVLLLPLPLATLARRWNPRLLLALAAMYCLILACVLPLCLRNVHEFGSLLPLNAGFGTPAWRLPHFSTAIYALRSFIFPWSEFWHGLTGLLFLLPFCFYGTWTLIYRCGWRQLASQPVLFAALAITLALYLWLNTRYDQAEGRYLFAAWPALQLALIGRPRSKFDLWLLFAVSLWPYALFIVPLTGA